jgi:hypothetical protein
LVVLELLRADELTEIVMLLLAFLQLFFAMCMFEVMWDVAVFELVVVTDVPTDQSVYLHFQVYYLTLKIHAQQFFEMLVTIYHLTLCSIPDEQNVLHHQCENLKSYVVI